MDKLPYYVTLIKDVIKEWAQASNSDANVETFTIFDDEHGQYLLVSAGWTALTREHEIIFHAHLRDGKVWIEWDGTTPSMTEALVQRGLLLDDLVLNWQDPDVRALLAATAPLPKNASFRRRGFFVVAVWLPAMQGDHR